MQRTSRWAERWAQCCFDPRNVPYDILLLTRNRWYVEGRRNGVGAKVRSGNTLHLDENAMIGQVD